MEQEEERQGVGVVSLQPATRQRTKQVPALHQVTVKLAVLVTPLQQVNQATRGLALCLLLPPQEDQDSNFNFRIDFTGLIIS